MLSACPCPVFRRPVFRRPVFRRLPALAVAVALALASGGCSYKLGGFFGSDEKPETTNSVAKPARQKASAPAEADLAIARAAVHDVLSRGGQDASVPWENPRTGARGTVTPIAAAYNQDGFTCRDFLASYVREGDESWLQGEACRVHQGKWEVKNLRPLKS
jgi:17 kDa outer membrane surface antigen